MIGRKFIGRIKRLNAREMLLWTEFCLIGGAFGFSLILAALSILRQFQ